MQRWGLACDGHITMRGNWQTFAIEFYTQDRTDSRAWRNSIPIFCGYVRSRVVALLCAFLLVDPHKELQPFVQDCLNAFLQMLARGRSNFTPRRKRARAAREATFDMHPNGRARRPCASKRPETAPNVRYGSTPALPFRLNHARETELSPAWLISWVSLPPRTYLVHDRHKRLSRFASDRFTLSPARFARPRLCAWHGQVKRRS
jgi:hypothetical protein